MTEIQNPKHVLEIGNCMSSEAFAQEGNLGFILINQYNSFYPFGA